MILYQNGKSRFYPSAYDLSHLRLLTSTAVLDVEFLPVEKTLKSSQKAVSHSVLNILCTNDIESEVKYLFF